MISAYCTSAAYAYIFLLDRLKKPSPGPEADLKQSFLLWAGLFFVFFFIVFYMKNIVLLWSF